MLNNIEVLVLEITDRRRNLNPAPGFARRRTRVITAVIHVVLKFQNGIVQGRVRVKDPVRLEKITLCRLLRAVCAQLVVELEPNTAGEVFIFDYVVIRYEKTLRNEEASSPT